jgi:phosphate transport system protein
MTRTRFHQGLDHLKELLLTMGGMVESSLEQAVRAYRERDADLARKVLEREAAINTAERDIDQLALDLLAMQQPMAVDLRFILAVIKSNSDLERMGDQAVNIAQRALEISSLPPLELAFDVARMAALSLQMLREALDAFVAEDAEAAQRVLLADDEVDRINDQAFQAVQRALRRNPEQTTQALDALVVARNLERVADHATNIAEDVIFWTRGADVRHRAGAADASPRS